MNSVLLIKFFIYKEKLTPLNIIIVYVHHTYIVRIVFTMYEPNQKPKKRLLDKFKSFRLNIKS